MSCENPDGIGVLQRWGTESHPSDDMTVGPRTTGPEGRRSLGLRWVYGAIDRSFHDPLSGASTPMPQPKSPQSAKPTRAGGGASRGAPKTPAVAGTTPPQTAAEAQAARDELLRQNLAQLRELLAGGVMLTASRVQEAMDDAVRKGKMTRRDAEELARQLVDTGRRQSFDLLAEIEHLLERSKGDLPSAATLLRDGTERVRREVGRVRQAAGVAPGLPIADYDTLTAAQITSQLEGLSSAELRRIRDHERTHANRKTVLAALGRELD